MAPAAEDGAPTDGTAPTATDRTEPAATDETAPPVTADHAPLTVVLDMQDRRPAWAMPPWVPGRIREALPPGSILRVMDVPSDGSGDGTARAHPEVLAAVEDADAYLGYGIPAEVLRRGGRLRWVHSGAAGVGSSLTPELRAADVVFTNSAGIHADPIAETVLGMILHFVRGLDFAAAAAARETGRWDTGPFYAAGTPVGELSRSTVGIVGFGGVGRAVGARCAALGARVLGLRRSLSVPGPVASALELPGGRGRVEVEVWRSPEGLGPLLEGSDVVVLSAPETPETRGLVDAGALARMKPSALLVNVGRGGLVDEEALVDALRAGGLRGAALDVARQEPLPDDHPLWTLPNVLVTPHVSAVTDAFWERQTALVAENVRRLASGKSLRNVVDPERGY